MTAFGSLPARRRPRLHRTTLLWIHRVIFDDEPIQEAGLVPVRRAQPYVTGPDCEGLPDASLVRAGRP